MLAPPSRPARVCAIRAQSLRFLTRLRSRGGSHRCHEALPGSRTLDVHPTRSAARDCTTPPRYCALSTVPSVLVARRSKHLRILKSARQHRGAAWLQTLSPQFNDRQPAWSLRCHRDRQRLRVRSREKCSQQTTRAASTTAMQPACYRRQPTRAFGLATVIHFADRHPMIVRAPPAPHAILAACPCIC